MTITQRQANSVTAQETARHWDSCPGIACVNATGDTGGSRTRTSRTPADHHDGHLLRHQHGGHLAGGHQPAGHLAGHQHGGHLAGHQSPDPGHHPPTEQHPRRLSPRTNWGDRCHHPPKGQADPPPNDAARQHLQQTRHRPQQTTIRSTPLTTIPATHHHGHHRRRSDTPTGLDPSPQCAASMADNTRFPRLQCTRKPACRWAANRLSRAANLLVAPAVRDAPASERAGRRRAGRRLGV